ncbi:MAG TPA: hypothetical protein VND45_11055 [Thermoanaerobaculia bacterium]|jgi:hypothetical protein|nr:hypothetical protein [Thermoanaerobaculia bacterium]
MPVQQDVRIHSFRVHVCRERDDRHFAGWVEAGDARFVFWNVAELLEILRLEVGGEDVRLDETVVSRRLITVEAMLPIH